MTRAKIEISQNDDASKNSTVRGGNEETEAVELGRQNSGLDLHWALTLFPLGSEQGSWVAKELLTKVHKCCSLCSEPASAETGLASQSAGTGWASPGPCFPGS